MKYIIIIAAAAFVLAAGADAGAQSKTGKTRQTTEPAGSTTLKWAPAVSPASKDELNDVEPEKRITNVS